MHTDDDICGRIDARSSATRLALIHAAEMLFADHGVDGASVRQIARAAGSANSSVVGYHFGDKEDLAAAVILHRLPPIEAQRAALLDECKGRSLSTEVLLDIMYRPLLEQTDVHGRRSYVRFLAGLERSGGMKLRKALGARFPVTQRLLDLIRETMPPDARAMFAPRFKVVAAMVHGAIAMMDDDKAELTPDFADMLGMAAAALCAPTRENGPGCALHDRGRKGEATYD